MEQLDAALFVCRLGRAHPLGAAPALTKLLAGVVRPSQTSPVELSGQGRLQRPEAKGVGWWQDRPATHRTDPQFSLVPHGLWKSGLTLNPEYMCLMKPHFSGYLPLYG